MLKTVDGKELKPGMVVSTAFRKTALYAIVEIETKSITIDRVRTSAGYPSAGDRLKMLRIKDVNDARLTYVGYQKNPMNVNTIYVNTPSERSIEEMYKSHAEPNIVKEFMRLLQELSPENISCDGELSMSQIRKREADIERKWKILETYVGHKVSKVWPKSCKEILA